MSLIITIGRQFGSGGRDVGEKVAEYFNIPFYDKELVELAAQKSNISKEALKEVDEHATNSFLYSLASGNYSMRGINAPIYYEMPINDKLFIAQADVIKEVAKRGSCVIVGRCADYVLENENVDVLSVFVYGSVDYRAKRVMSALDITQAKAKPTNNVVHITITTQAKIGELCLITTCVLMLKNSALKKLQI